MKASRLPDDVQLLQRLVEDGLIVATPPQDYDDSYCIKYAMARDGCVLLIRLLRERVSVSLYFFFFFFPTCTPVQSQLR